MVKIDHKVQMTKTWSTQTFSKQISRLLLFNLFAQFLRFVQLNKHWKNLAWKSSVIRDRLQISLLILSEFNKLINFIELIKLGGIEVN